MYSIACSAKWAWSAMRGPSLPLRGRETAAEGEVLAHRQTVGTASADGVGELGGSAARLALLGREVLVELLNRDGAFTDGRRHTLDRAMAHVPGGEHAR